MFLCCGEKLVPFVVDAPVTPYHPTEMLCVLVSLAERPANNAIMGRPYPETFGIPKLTFTYYKPPHSMRFCAFSVYLCSFGCPSSSTQKETMPALALAVHQQRHLGESEPGHHVGAHGKDVRDDEREERYLFYAALLWYSLAGMLGRPRMSYVCLPRLSRSHAAHKEIEERKHVLVGILAPPAERAPVLGEDAPGSPDGEHY